MYIIMAIFGFSPAKSMYISQSLPAAGRGLSAATELSPPPGHRGLRPVRSRLGKRSHERVGQGKIFTGMAMSLAEGAGEACPAYGLLALNATRNSAPGERLTSSTVPPIACAS